MPRPKNDPGRTRQTRTDRAVDLLAAGRSQVEVAATLGVSTREVRRWLDDPVVRQELALRQDDLRDQTQARLMALADDAVAALGEMIRGRDADGEPVKVEMGRVKAVQVWSELLGYHKGNPVRRVERQADIETEEDLALVLRDLPLRLLRAEVARRDADRADPPAPAPTANPTKSL